MFKECFSKGQQSLPAPGKGKFGASLGLHILLGSPGASGFNWAEPWEEWMRICPGSSNIPPPPRVVLSAGKDLQRGFSLNPFPFPVPLQSQGSQCALCSPRAEGTIFGDPKIREVLGENSKEFQFYCLLCGS